MIAVVANVCLLLAGLWLWKYFSTSNTTDVPIVPGLPLLGNTIALGRGGVAFITQCRQKYGDVFCLRLLNQKMVFVFDSSLLTLFLKAPESSISFKPAVERFTERVYGLPSLHFFSVHEKLLTTLRQLLAPDKLEVMAQQLIQYAQPQLDNWKQKGRVELWSSCQHLVFSCAGQVLFGKQFFQRHGLEDVQKAFLTFEENFEVAASPVPHLLLPRFRAARAKLLSMFAESLSQGDFKGSVVELLLTGCDLSPKYWPNLLLAVLWASQANSMPALFWSLAMLMLPEQAASRQRIVQQLKEPVQQQQQQQQQQQMCTAVASESSSTQRAAQDCGQTQLDAATAVMIRLAMDKRSYASRCVSEVIRLRSHSIAVRFVSTDNLTLAVNQACNTGNSNGGQANDPQVNPKPQQRLMRVPAGTILAICPFESHHDQILYPDKPWTFNPDRADVQGLEPGTVVPSIAGLGFGGGMWRCPGRFFAEMELALFVQLVLHQVQLVPEAVVDNQGHSVTRPSTCTPSTHCFQPADTTQRSAAQGLNMSSPLASSILNRWVRGIAVCGAGCFGGSQQQAQAWCCSGDLRRLLPQPNLLRLVGLKVPLGCCWVSIKNSLCVCLDITRAMASARLPQHAGAPSAAPKHVRQHLAC